MVAYHTALAPDQSDAEPRNGWTRDGNHAFTHDFRDGLPQSFLFADFIYGEPPWADGYEEFNRRAGITDALPFPRLMYRLNVALARSGKPWAVLVGAAAARHLGCEWMVRSRLFDSLVAIVGAGCEPPPAGIDSEDVIRHFINDPRVRTIADFCAGYGRTAKLAVEAGKKFIATDMNPVCIGHIAREYDSWKP